MAYKIVFRYVENGEERAEQASVKVNPASAVRAFIINNDLTANDWIAGDVYTDTDKLEASLAFNGRPYK